MQAVFHSTIVTSLRTSRSQRVEHYARILREKAAERGWTYDKHYGPHDLTTATGYCQAASEFRI